MYKVLKLVMVAILQESFQLQILILLHSKNSCVKMTKFVRST